MYNKMINYAEDTSHAFLGESREGPVNKEVTPIQRVLAHGLGYATSPLRYGMELVSDAILRRFPGRSGEIGGTSSTEPPIKSMPPKVKAKTITQVVYKKKPKGRKKKPKQGTRYRTMPAMRKAGRSRGGKSMFMVGRSKTRVFAPPVAMGFVKSQTNAFRFGAGRKLGCMMMSGMQYLGGINVYNDGTNSWPVLLTQDRTPIAEEGAITQFQVMPQNSFYFGNPIFNMTQMFERFQIRTRLRFKTILGTSTPGSLKLAYYDDPIAFFAMTGKQGVVTYTLTPFPPLFSDAPTAQNMSAIQTLVEGSIWKDFSTGWSYRQKNEEMKYVPAPFYNQPMNPATTTSIDMRQSVEGTWIIGGNTQNLGSTGTYTKIGELWIDYQLELCDIMSNAPVNGPAFSLRQPKRVSDHVDQKNSARLSKIEALLNLQEQKVQEKKEQKEPVESKTHEVFDPVTLRREVRVFSKSSSHSLEEDVRSVSDEEGE